MSFVCVDGGASDNEPFQLARWTIRNLSRDEKGNPRDGLRADRAIIMVAPFPNPASFEVDFSGLTRSRLKDLNLNYVTKKLISVLLDQSRFKLADLLEAVKDGVCSRFLITPSRGGGMERPALACGLLGAFGGFLDEQFREHDFQLGRLNCREFLRTTFVLPKEHGMFKSPFGEPSDEEKFEWEYRPIIPLHGKACEEVRSPPWPGLAEEQLAHLGLAIERRVRAVGRHLINYHVKTWPVRLVTQWVGAIVVRRLAPRLLAMVESELYWSQQIKSRLEPKEKMDYYVIAALRDPSYDLRTISGIVTACKARDILFSLKSDVEQRSAVESSLASLWAKRAVVAMRLPRNKRRRGLDRRAYALKAQAPGWIRRLARKSLAKLGVARPLRIDYNCDNYSSPARS